MAFYFIFDTCIHIESYRVYCNGYNPLSFSYIFFIFKLIRMVCLLNKALGHIHSIELHGILCGLPLVIARE